MSEFDNQLYKLPSLVLDKISSLLNPVEKACFEKKYPTVVIRLINELIEKNYTSKKFIDVLKDVHYVPDGRQTSCLFDYAHHYLTPSKEFIFEFQEEIVCNYCHKRFLYQTDLTGPDKNIYSKRKRICDSEIHLKKANPWFTSPCFRVYCYECKVIFSIKPADFNIYLCKKI